MADILLLIATWACGAFGLGLLAFSQKQHWALLRRGRSVRPPTWLALSGWSLLGAAILPAIWRDGIAFGLLVWGMVLTLSALAIAALLTRLSIAETNSNGR